jgi:hypothetical protein
MIRAIITDVDGVLVGKTPGINFPNPNEKVLEKLKQIHEKGIPVILCTAKSLFPNLPTIEDAHLDNLHIMDGGSVIIDPLKNKTTIHPLSKEIVEKILYFALENDIYIELHALGKYFVEESQVSDFTKDHTEIMQQEPTIVPALIEIISQEEIIKIMLILPTEEDKGLVTPLFEGLQKDISTFWGLHPTMVPAQFGVITAHGVSKKHGAEEIIKNLGISFDEVLGIGDTKGDWAFLQLCKYVGVVGDDQNLITFAKEKGEGNYFIAPNVEENGIMHVFEHFEL